MEKQEYIKRYSAEPADKILLANVIDRIDIAQRKNIPQHTRFLDERQQELIRRICEKIWEQIICFTEDMKAQSARYFCFRHHT